MKNGPLGPQQKNFWGFLLIVDPKKSPKIFLAIFGTVDQMFLVIYCMADTIRSVANMMRGAANTMHGAADTMHGVADTMHVRCGG